MYNQGIFYCAQLFLYHMNGRAIFIANFMKNISRHSSSFVPSHYCLAPYKMFSWLGRDTWVGSILMGHVKPTGKIVSKLKLILCSALASHSRILVVPSPQIFNPTHHALSKSTMGLDLDYILGLAGWGISLVLWPALGLVFMA